jgi:hypothetical protein
MASLPRDLGDALRALPLEAPDANAWPALATRIADARRPPRVRRGAWLALAASVVAALLVLASGRLQTPGTGGSVAQAGGIVELMAESAQLERVLASASDDVAGNASALVLILQVEDRLRAIDAELARPGLDDARRHALWQQRVEVLHVAAGMESSRRYYAAQGRALEPTLVATY